MYPKKTKKPNPQRGVCQPCQPVTLDKAQIHLSNMVAEISKAPREEHGSMDEEPLIRWSWDFPQESNIKIAGMFLKTISLVKENNMLVTWLVGS